MLRICLNRTYKSAVGRLYMFSAPPKFTKILVLINTLTERSVCPALKKTKFLLFGRDLIEVIVDEAVKDLSKKISNKK